MNFLLSNAIVVGAASPAGGGIEMIIMIALFFGIMYFMIIRPQQKKAKEHKTMLDALSKGDEVVTSGGILGKIVKIGENFVEIKVSDNSAIKVQRHSIGTVLPKGTMKSA
ncbi:MAG TPA: preprotein translocase subunit YajC [Leucothrix mucor]|nr:preprotein translocase subunit YajC [Leucothrix mucor]